MLKWNAYFIKKFKISWQLSKYFVFQMESINIYVLSVPIIGKGHFGESSDNHEGPFRKANAHVEKFTWNPYFQVQPTPLFQIHRNPHSSPWKWVLEKTLLNVTSDFNRVSQFAFACLLSKSNHDFPKLIYTFTQTPKVFQT